MICQKFRFAVATVVQFYLPAFHFGVVEILKQASSDDLL
jgi:hypothetical protein